MAATKGGSKQAVYIVVVVLIVAGLAAWAVAMFRGGGSDSSSGAATYPVAVQGSVVVAGKAAPHTVDVYEDMLCPICGRFESRYNGKFTDALNAGKIQVRYHPVAILNKATTPNGYSLRAANAVICAAEANIFPAYHEKLFAEQPAERSAGLSDQQLIEMGQSFGAPGTFAQCVTSGKHAKAVTAETTRASKDTSLRRAGSDGFGTPTVTLDGKRVEVNSDDWLTEVTG